MSTLCIAILDGPIQRDHPSLHWASIEQNDDPDASDLAGPATRHGTAVASLIFGSFPRSGFAVARRCRAVSFPIIGDRETTRSSSAGALARAIRGACEQGANIINISAGQPDVKAIVDPELAGAIHECVQSNVLIIAAAGEGGCRWPQNPANLPGVLAVEARNAAHHIATNLTGNCVAAPAQYNAALAGGGISEVFGSSFACALVTGAAALLALDQQDRGEPFDARRIREVLLTTVRSQGPMSMMGDFENLLASPTESMAVQRFFGSAPAFVGLGS